MSMAEAAGTAREGQDPLPDQIGGLISAYQSGRININYNHNHNQK